MKLNLAIVFLFAVGIQVALAVPIPADDLEDATEDIAAGLDLGEDIKIEAVPSAGPPADSLPADLDDPKPADPIPDDLKPADPISDDLLSEDPKPADLDDPKPADPVEADPIPDDPKPADPISDDLLSEDPKPADPISDDLISDDPKPADPVEADPIPDDPKPADPISDDLISDDPVPADPKPADPIPDEPSNDLAPPPVDSDVVGSAPSPAPAYLPPKPLNNAYLPPANKDQQQPVAVVAVAPLQPLYYHQPIVLASAPAYVYAPPTPYAHSAWYGQRSLHGQGIYGYGGYSNALTYAHAQPLGYGYSQSYLSRRSIPNVKTQ